MFLHGEDNHRIEWRDTIRNPKLLYGEDRLKHFDVVVANPPFRPVYCQRRKRTADMRFGVEGTSLHHITVLRHRSQ